MKSNTTKEEFLAKAKAETDAAVKERKMLEAKMYSVNMLIDDIAVQLRYDLAQLSDR